MLADVCHLNPAAQRHRVRVQCVEPLRGAQALAKITPVPNNLDGEYLTMFSRGGLIFGIINLVGKGLHPPRLPNACDDQFSPLRQTKMASSLRWPVIFPSQASGLTQLCHQDMSACL